MGFAKPLGGAALLAAACGGVALTHPGHPAIPAPTVHYQSQPAGAPFELFRGQRIILDGTINGRATNMMLDSGAGMTVVDRAFADSIGLKGSQSLPVRGAGGEVPGEIATNVSISAAG